MKMKHYIDPQARCSLEKAVCVIPTPNYNLKFNLDIGEKTRSLQACRAISKDL